MRAVHDQVYSFLSTNNSRNNYLSSSQSGFRTQFSTATTVIDVQDYILKYERKVRLLVSFFLISRKLLIQ